MAAALAAVVAAPAAAGTGWTSVGRAMLEGGTGTASAELHWQAAFRELLVCADGGAVKLGDATLRFRDGTSRPLKLRTRLAGGDCTDPLSIGRKELASIDFAYEAGAAGGANRLSIVGR
jgi:hypothetical protein